MHIIKKICCTKNIYNTIKQPSNYLNSSAIVKMFGDGAECVPIKKTVQQFAKNIAKMVQKIKKKSERHFQNRRKTNSKSAGHRGAKKGGRKITNSR